MAATAASDLNESMNAMNVPFGETSDEIKVIGETSAESFGLSQRAFNEMAARFSPSPPPSRARAVTWRA